MIAGDTGGLQRPRRGGTSKYAVGIFDGEIRLGGVPTYPVSDVILVPFPRCFSMNTRILGSRSMCHSGHPLVWALDSPDRFTNDQECKVDVSRIDV